MLPTVFCHKSNKNLFNFNSEQQCKSASHLREQTNGRRREGVHPRHRGGGHPAGQAQADEQDDRKVGQPQPASSTGTEVAVLVHVPPAFHELHQEPDALRSGAGQNQDGPGDRRPRDRHLGDETSEKHFEIDSRLRDIAGHQQGSLGQRSQLLSRRFDSRKTREAHPGDHQLEIGVHLPRRHPEPLPGNVLHFRALALPQPSLSNRQRKSGPRK
jgi:hypothetical protein